MGEGSQKEIVSKVVIIQEFKPVIPK